MADLDLSIADGIATLTMNRPDARNALSPQMYELFAQYVPQLAADPEVRVLILTGAGGVFSGGGDIRGMLQMRDSVTVESGRDRMRRFHGWFQQFVHLDKPVIAAVDGPAFGAGFSLALAADFVLCAPKARFCMSFMRIGLVPDFGALYTLPRAVGVQRAKELMLSAREVSAEEAVRLGLALEIVPSADALLPRAREFAAALVQASPLATGLVKQDLAMSLSADLREMLALEAEQQSLLFQTAAHRQAVDRFLAKEPTAFQWPARLA